VRADGGSCTIALHTDGAAGEWSNFDDIELVAGAAKLSVLGADVSSLAKSEDLGGLYFDDRGGHRPPRPRNALGILEDHGATHVRLRVWVDPADGYHDAAEAARMARRAHAQGLEVLVDLHYSDTWADPAHQTKPAAWASYTTEQLRQAVYEHTYAVCKAVSVRGRGPAMIQIGNELNAGMLWPDGHTFDPPNWDNLAGFLQAGYDAVKACSPRTKVAIHLANGGDNGLYRWWFDNITQRGVSFDVIAASYYGYWHGSLGDLQWNLTDVAARYGKDVVVAETAYPFTLDGDDSHPNLIGLPEQLVPGYPATREGQARNFRDVLSIVRAIPDGRGLGAFYWDATWTAVPGNGWDPTDPTSGNAWENQALFDFDGRAVEAMGEYRR
jgi:arabinogalactan endo-1,4-beta-galactosidase